MPDFSFFSWLCKKFLEMFRVRDGIQIGNALILLKPLSRHGQWRLVLRSALDIILEESFSTQEIKDFFKVLNEPQNKMFTYSTIIRGIDITVEHKMKNIYIQFLLQRRDKVAFYLYRKDIEPAYSKFCAYLQTMEGA